MFQHTHTHLQELRGLEDIGVNDESVDLLENYVDFVEDLYADKYREFMGKKKELEN